MERLLNCGYHHIIFTIPHELNEIWLLNVKVMTNILFLAVKDTLFDFFLDKKHIGGKPGLIASLQTWTETQMLHPHIHCLATEGGLSKDGKWVTRRRLGYLFRSENVMEVYRGKLRDYIDKAVRKGNVKLPAGMTYQKWVNLKNKLGRVKWNVYICNRYEYGNGVLSYLARYIRGGPISNRRILSFKEGEVTFLHQQGKGKAHRTKDTITLPVDRFLRRYFLHVPERYTRVVRYYGVYAPNKKEELAECRRQLGQEPVKEAEAIETEQMDWQSYCESRGDDHPELCPVCGRRLVRLADIPRITVSPDPPDEKRKRWAA
jgi:hypothetical protein